MTFLNTVYFPRRKPCILTLCVECVWYVCVFIFVVTNVLPIIAIHCFFMTLHINACRLTKKPQKIIRCCHFLIFLWVEETEVFVIAIHCFEVLDSDCSKKVASKVEKCCVHDIQAKICFFLLWEWWFHTFGAKAQETSMEVGVGTKVKIQMRFCPKWAPIPAGLDRSPQVPAGPRRSPQVKPGQVCTQIWNFNVGVMVDKKKTMVRVAHRICMISQ